MKTLRHKEAGNLKRRPDEEAHKMFETGKWEYVPKSLWKEQTRDIDIKQPNEEKQMTKKKANEISKATKRHLRKQNK